MIAVIPVLLLTVLLLCLGIRFLVPQKQTGKLCPTAAELAEAVEEVHATMQESHAIVLACRRDDLKYLSKDPSLVDGFRKERKKIMLDWIRRLRRTVHKLHVLHEKLARSNSDPNVMTEYRVAWQYLNFVTFSYTLYLLIWILGPFVLRRAVNFVNTASLDLCQLFAVRLNGVENASMCTATGEKLGVTSGS